MLTVSVAKKRSSKHTQGMRWMEGCKPQIWYCKQQDNRTDSRISLHPLFSTIYACNNLDAEFRFTVYKLNTAMQGQPAPCHLTRTQLPSPHHPYAHCQYARAAQFVHSNTTQTTALLSRSHIWSLAAPGSGRSTLRNRLQKMQGVVIL